MPPKKKQKLSESASSGGVFEGLKFVLTQAVAHLRHPILLEKGTVHDHASLSKGEVCSRKKP
jgi:hypothetical protein